MPPTTRAKRKLAETDGNAHIAPEPRRASPTSSPKDVSKENEDPGVRSTINTETAKPAAEKIATGIPDATTTPSEDGEEERAAPDDPSRQWICICRPEAVRRKEQASEAIRTRELLCGKSRVGGPKFMCFESADAFPEHKWVTTLAGRRLFRAWKLEQHLRDPDCYGREITVPIFSNWSGYGICEVIENMFLAFGKHLKAEPVDIMAIWPLIESMAHFLNSDIEDWYPINDNQGNGKRVMLIGTALLTTIDLLKTRDLFNPRSSTIRNVGLTLAMFIKFAHTFRALCRLNEDGWVVPVIKAAESRSIGIKGPANIKNILKSIRQDRSITRDDDAPKQSDKPPKSRADLKKTKENMTKAYAPKPTTKYGGLITMDFFNEGTRREWEAWDWATEVKAYSKEQAVKIGPYGPVYSTRIGGKFYDLTAPGQRGRHAGSFRGPPDRLPTEDSEDVIPPEDIVYCPSGKPAVLVTFRKGPDGGPKGWCGRSDKCEATCGTVPNEWVRNMTAKAKAKYAERQR